MLDMQFGPNLFNDSALGQHRADTEVCAVIVVNIRLIGKAALLPVIGGHNVGLIDPQPCQNRYEDQINIARKISHDNIKRVPVFELQRGRKRRGEFPLSRNTRSISGFCFSTGTASVKALRRLFGLNIGFVLAFFDCLDLKRTAFERGFELTNVGAQVTISLRVTARHRAQAHPRAGVQHNDRRRRRWRGCAGYAQQQGAQCHTSGVTLRFHLVTS